MPNELDNGNVSFNVLPKISVFGVGGAGINAVNNMILSQLDFDIVKFVVANTDCQSLADSPAKIKIQLGAECTKGLGAGADPEIGRKSAEESIEKIKKELTGTNMLFIASGMGGGTGTGASPVIAKIAQEMGILTIAIVIKPFNFEGKRRMDTANSGVKKLEQIVDTLIVIENQKLMTLNNVSMAENYAIADGILRQAVYCIVSILSKKGYINRDFADIKTILTSMGRAVIGYGEDIDAKIATDNAIHNPILENSSIYGAKNILVNITGGINMKPNDFEEIVEKIKNEAKTTEEEEPNILFGNVFDDEIGNNIRVSVIAAGVKQKKNENVEENKVIDIKSEKNNDTVSSDIDSEEIENSKIEAPVFVKPLNEEDLENDESFNLKVEDIPRINDNISSFQNTFFQTCEEKKKINKTTNFEQKKNVNIKTTSEIETDKVDNTIQFGLFDSPKKTKKSLLSRIMNSIGPSTYIDEEIDTKDIFKQEQEQDDANDVYDTPAIKRKIG